jgi:hypothetical protein
MSDYKLYLLRAGHIEKRHDLTSADDAKAIADAERLAGGQAAELWCGERLVKRFPQQPR